MRNFAILIGAMNAIATLGCGAQADDVLDDVMVIPDMDATPASERAETDGAGRDGRAAVGRQLFFDENLSTPPGQACATCHARNHAFTDPDAGVPTSEGVIAGRFGGRNTPTAAYAKFSPAFHYDAETETYVGGQFWDGRAPSLEEQAKGPFLNPIEMNNPDRATVVNKVRSSRYAGQFRRVFGPSSLDDVDTAYDRIAEAIAAFERTERFSPFTSKYDAYLAGEATLTAAEARGLALFENPNKGNCAACHPSQPSDDGTPPLFTDFTYDNLGLPKNPANPFYAMPATFNPAGAAFVDRGLGGAVGDPAEDGKFKVPTLRNLSRTGPYTHAGYFTDLRSLVSFYNSRDVAAWPAPEIPETMNRDELGDLGLTDREIDDIVAFLGTLTDGYCR